MLLTVLFYTAVSLIAINLIYLFSLTSLIRWKADENAVSSEPVSIIVCAKNEEQNLRKLIPILLKQDYSDFEIIAINDCSSDGTREVIDEFASQDQRVRAVNVVPNEAFWGKKKYALTLGIKKAKYQKLLFTDADCLPTSNEWLGMMSNSFTENSEVVLGYGAYAKKAGVLNAIIRFETGMTAIQYLNHALNGLPYMGVGRNLAYSSDLFYQARGFQDHLHILGGDDDLFINQVAKSSNTAIQLSPNAFTISEPETSWSSWWKQKRRHINTAQHYKTKHKILLGTFHASQLGVYLSIFLLPFLIPPFLWILAGALISRFLLAWLIYGLNLNKLNEENLIPCIPILELMLLLSHLGLLVHNSTSKPRSW